MFRPPLKRILVNTNSSELAVARKLLLGLAFELLVEVGVLVGRLEMGVRVARTLSEIQTAGSTRGRVQVNAKVQGRLVSLWAGGVCLRWKHVAMSFLKKSITHNEYIAMMHLFPSMNRHDTLVQMPRDLGYLPFSRQLTPRDNTGGVVARDMNRYLLLATYHVYYCHH